jgi:DNA (cytosine-5)-methyltransferase 1
MNKENLNELALFAGAGGGILGGHLLGWRTVCAVEWEQYPASVLCARQNDGLLPPFPIWDDVQTFDGKPWRGIVDVVSGGFPCQDISAAGGGLALTENEAECGEKWRGSFVKYSPDSCSWKTHQCSLLGDLDEFLETWPQWGLMFNGECWDMTDSVVNTGETEFGLLATPTKELFSHWSSAKAKISTGGKRKSGVKVGSILWWEMTEQHLRLGGQEDKKLIPDPSCGEIVMGWPMGWTELQQLEMDKFQEWQRQHGVY